MRAVIRRMDSRLHLQDGPIDLIVEAFGAAEEIARAYRAAAARFGTILDELCAELPLLRSAGERGERRLQERQRIGAAGPLPAGRSASTHAA